VNAVEIPDGYHRRLATVSPSGHPFFGRIESRKRH